jgi:hypothetical protein
VELDADPTLDKMDAVRVKSAVAGLMGAHRGWATSTVGAILRGGDAAAKEPFIALVRDLREAASAARPSGVPVDPDHVDVVLPPDFDSLSMRDAIWRVLSTAQQFRSQTELVAA